MIKNRKDGCTQYGFSLRQYLRSIVRSKKGYIELSIPIIWDQ